MLKQIIILILLLPLIFAKTVEICENKTIPDKGNECNAVLSISTEKSVYNNKEKIEIINNLTVKNKFIIEYWVEDSNSTIIKTKRNTTNIEPKSYTPALINTDKLKIKNSLVYLECNNTNNITSSEKEILVFISNEPNPFIKIKDNRLSVKLNQTLNFRLDIYTGNLSNSTLIYEIINITGKTEIVNSYSIYNLTLYIDIPYYCNIQSDNYTLKITAFNSELTKNVEIINNCNINQPEIDYNSTELEDNLHSESHINITENPLTGNVVFESTAVKSKNIALYLIIGLVIMAITYLPGRLLIKRVTT